MEPNAFVAEVYRRMALRHAGHKAKPSFAEISVNSQVKRAELEYKPLLPKELNAPILDLGFGDGWFIAACLKLGYTSLSGADFGIANKAYVKDWAPSSITLHSIDSDIGDFLADQPGRYQFIHMSHVIEHIPKYSLLWITDALYQALQPGGTLCLRTPNMEGPAANSSLYVTLAHEYGFAGSNLTSLLDICGFDDIQLHDVNIPLPTLRQRLGALARKPMLFENKLRHRLFGVNQGGQFGPELVVTARRGNFPPHFNPKYR